MPAAKKIKFMSFSKPDFTGKEGEYTARLNPENYQEAVAISYKKMSSPGTSAGPSQFINIQPRTINIELLFDATGAVENSATDLAKEIKDFKKVVCLYQGSIHSPYYIKIYWGKMHIGARLTSLDLNYTLFKPNGAPLRAKATCKFLEFVDSRTQAKKDNAQSPDVTHAITVVDGDTLPLLCQRIYGDPNMYMAVARFNDLTSFRQLATGQQLIFPPLVA